MFKRSLFEKELAEIREGVRQLGAQATRATASAARALAQNDLEEARRVKREDRATDRLRYEVENACLRTIATQQPVARDLRELLASTFVAVELERCGDYAKGIAKAARRIRPGASEPALKLDAFLEMDALARDMLERSVRAYLQRDLDLARVVLSEDEKLDELYRGLVRAAMHEMSKHASLIESGMWLMHAGHCLERIGDRATNVAERIIFIETGVLKADLHTEDGAEWLKIEN